MGALTAETIRQLGTDWGAVQTATRNRVSRQRTAAGDAAWHRWATFCSTLLSVDPWRLPRDAIPRKSLQTAYAPVPSAPAANTSALAQWGRRMPTWGPRTLA